MFTDRFIKVPIRTYSQRQAELTGKPEYEETWEAVVPFEISTYYPSKDPDVGEGEYTQICLKSGKDFMAYISPDKFEKLLNAVK
jgi:hypothetical protein